MARGDGAPVLRNGNPRKASTGRPNALSDPEYANAVAEAFVAGCSREEMCDMFNVSLSTISRYRRDHRVKVLALKKIEDRVLRITRRTDSIIEERLRNAKDIDTDTLLRIRKEYLGGALRTQTEKADSETINEASSEIENNPSLIDDLQKLVADKKK